MHPLLVRIFDVDFYLSAPVANLDVTFSQFRGCATHQVPIIRIFGSTDNGKKICVHIHGVFPYFYIPYDGSEPASGLMYKIASSLDKAINISLGQASSINQHIYKIVLVSGIPFYGYHSKKHQFFKVYLYNPMLIKRVNNLLFNENVLGKIYQPHETHLNFTLQFMIDYNLHGMSNIILSQAKFRYGTANEEFMEDTLCKVSSCELECDTLCEYILNLQEIESGKLAANPGIAALWEDEKQRRRNKNEDSQLPHYLSLSKTNVPPTESHELFKRALRERLALLSQDPEKNEFNLSVYPAECPRNKALLNCSIVDFNSPHNSQSDISYDSEMDQTLMNDTLNLTVDEDVQDLLNVLKDLEKNVDIEEDSILSQVSKNEVEDMEDEYDMSIAGDDLLNETITISKLCDANEDIEIKDSEVCIGEQPKIPNIPQLDGNCQDFEMKDSINTISHLQEQSDAMVVELKMQKSRSYSSINTKRKTFMCTEENNNISLDYIVKLPNQDNCDTNKKEAKKALRNNFENKQSLIHDNTILFEVRISDEDVKFPLQRKFDGCEFNHKYPHVEDSMKMQLYQPNVIKSRILNHQIMQSIIDKVHAYFTADSIGERVAGKNSAKRKKLVVKNYLERPCELAVVIKNIHLPHIAKKKRDMPLLNSDSSDSEYSVPLSAFCKWKTLRKHSDTKESYRRKEVVKKSIIKQRFSGRREELHKIFHKKNLLVQKFCKEWEKDWNMLEKGAKPIFKVIPGYRPYVFQPIRKLEDIQNLNGSSNHIQFSHTVISKELSSSITDIEQKNSREVDPNAKLVSSRKSVEKSSTELKRTSNVSIKSQSKGSKQKTIKEKPEESIVKKKKAKSMLLEKKQEINKRMKQKKVEDDKKTTGGIQNETINDNEVEKIKQEAIKKEKDGVNSSLKNISFEKAPVLRNIEEIIKAQKKNETQFFRSVQLIMDHCTISEKKLLKVTDGDENNNDSTKRNVLFLDGANDDSDEDDSEKKHRRGSKKPRLVYSSLPIFKSAHSSGRSTPIRDQTDYKKEDEEKYTIEPKIRENMKKIRRRINFDSSSHIDSDKEDNYLDHKISLNQLEEEAHKKVKKEHDNLTNDEGIDKIYISNNSDVKIENSEYSNHIVREQPNFIKKEDLDISYAADDGCNISLSELYDIINNYNPQEGTSKCRHSPCKVSDYLESPSAINDSDIVQESLSVKPLLEDISTVEDVPIHSSGSISDMFSNELGEENKPISSNTSVYYKPLYKPPTRLDVLQNLSDYGIPQIRSQGPFYSNAEDAGGSMEIGYNLLKIKSLTSMDAQDFESSFEGIDHFRKRYYPEISGQGKKENPRYFYCPEGTCTLTPLKKPPTNREVVNWLKQNCAPSKVVEKSKIKKSKIYFASSQDIYSDNDISMDLSLTLSPATPKTDTTITNTPKSSSVCKETDIDSDVSTSKSESEIPRKIRRKTKLTKSSTPESNLDSDSSLREDSCNGDITLTPKSAQSKRSSPISTKSRRKKKLDKSMTLRKSALLSHSSEHSGVISGVSLNNTYGFKCSVQNYQDARASVKYEYLTILSMEIHVNTRGDFNPNPQYDSVQAIFYSISNDVEENNVKPRRCEGLFAINPRTDKETKSSFLDGAGIPYDIRYVDTELELFEEFIKFIIYWDPDILLGYEIQMLSWGFFIERCFNLGINVIPEISRVKDKHLKFNEKETGDLRVSGRVVLDLWRLLRHEIALQSYTIQSTVYEILQKRIPKYSFQDLTTWWTHQSSIFRHRTVDYYMTCVKCQLKLLEQLDFVGRTSELARLFGIQFYEVLSRGSQFRVESMMLRLAKPLNYVPVSPSVQQRAGMKAPEHIALVLEPESKFYTDPVIVLDFQSLYPSIIIAYNYCFSTCVGRVQSLGKNSPFEFGASNLRVSKERIKYLLKRNLLNFSPCGVAFVKKSVRDGIMPRMLREILDTRLMVKKSMKENREDAVLQKVLHNRQLGLKLIANVTYGYTAANFSGRMPSVELGDSIVSKARETLQRAISLVDNHKEWGVRVVYGDTDSLFVHCPGKSRSEAFAIGEQIVEAVDKENPDPLKLKLEKVYQPCILQTKKRYVGYMYESPDQKEPSYDAKGIETVRRDGCPAVAKMLEKTLRILFETKDVSKVKEYCLKQFNKIIVGRITMKDLTFAKEFRGLTGYRPGACVPSLELAKKWVAIDKRAEPRRGERVPYVIINGPPGLPLIRLVRSPHDLLKDPALRPNALYYITRVIIPPLNRCFNLIGADLHHWFLQMPRKQLQYLPTATSPTKRSTISQYFVSTLCATCGTQAQNGLCDACLKKPQETVIVLSERARQWEASYENCKLICCSCTQILDNPGCTSLDCPVLYRLNQTGRDLQQADHIRHLLAQYFDIF